MRRAVADFAYPLVQILLAPPAGQALLDLSELLQNAKQGDGNARADLVRVAYDDLRRLAKRQMQNERLDHTLTATALVHEVSARLLEQSQVPSQSRGEFLAYAATAMRNMLIDHARSKRSNKRGGQVKKIQLEEAFTAAEEQPEQLLELDDALKRLAQFDERRSQVVEMRYFAGMSIDEIASALDTSPATVKRDWNVAKMWLARELSQELESDG